jgi:hypothetical protein
MTASRRTLLALFFISTPVLGGELADRKTVAEGARALLIAGRYADLDALAERYRTSRSRTPSGLWHLSMFHVGTESALYSKKDDDAGRATAERRARQWIKARPRSPAARIAFAQMLVNRAWAIRGSGKGHTVKPEDWQPFRDHLERARLYLEEHKAVAAIDPGWYEAMAHIATDQSWPPERLEALVKEGLAREPAYYGLYFMAVRYYAPQWHGSAEDIERFARQAMDRTRAVEGAGMYARIYWYASQSHYTDKLFAESLVDWETMKKGIDDVLAKHADEWNIQNFARYACLAEDKEKTAQLLKRMTEAPYMEAWASPYWFDRCKAWALN